MPPMATDGPVAPRIRPDSDAVVLTILLSVRLEIAVDGVPMVCLPI